MEKLKKLILDSEEILMYKILNYAKERNYTKYTSTLKEAWRMSIEGLSHSLVKAINKSNSIPELGPDDDFTKSEIAEFGITEAQRHRTRGITLSMFLGLMKYYHQSYEDLILESNFLPKEIKYFLQYIKRFFDHVELGFITKWSELSEKSKLKQLQKANRNMTNEKNKYLTVFESIYDPIILIDKNNKIENINYKAAEVFLNQAISGIKYYGKINIDKEFEWLNEELIEFVNSNVNETLQEETLSTKTGEKIFLIKFKKMLDISEKYRGTVIIFYDITERTKIERELKIQHKKLEFYAFTDPMTGVSNRRTGFMILEKELPTLSRMDMYLSICFIDIDGLKIVNDTYGHASGDLLIKTIASTIKASIREIDTVSRIGGDEFLIIFPKFHESDANKVIKQIYNKLEGYNGIGEQPFKYSFSYGIVEITADCRLNANDIIKAADEKMYQNKLSKK
ncbi:sensor domain-containing diguanylate cyclase [Clostridium sp.]|uniref:sensor domain-containing diguanylate cyclase n=1 Tax=Clostridium sp. TaxID=1506 RepID=UPI00284CB9B9|nr:sensor domain-containing diguanylate cyclase [Clostridium sp.]MDR3593199.1 sensor domain-containing diguanylate cyclase [Clostridium sp.]